MSSLQIERNDVASSWLGKHRFGASVEWLPPLISANIWPIFRRGLRPRTPFLWRQRHLKVTPLPRIASHCQGISQTSCIAAEQLSGAVRLT